MDPEFYYILICVAKREWC